jgi:hypothetical protein
MNATQTKNFGVAPALVVALPAMPRVFSRSQLARKAVFGVRAPESKNSNIFF